MGAAIFTIPAGMATFSDSKRAIWFPTLGLLLGIGFLSAKSFVWIGQVCEETGAISYPQAWSHSIGPSTQWIPHIASLLTTLQAIVSYAIVLSTTLPQLWQALSSYFGIGIVAVSRRQALVGLMGGVLLPLCLLRSLSALAPFSFVGLLGLVYTAIVMTIRYLDGSYSSTTSSGDATAVIPSFGNRLDWWHPAVLVLAAKLGNAYMAHYQAPTMYHELWQGDNNHKHNDKKKTQFQKVVQISYLIVACLYTWMTMVGFGTFGAASTSFVLDSYSTTHDGLISASRCAIFVSLLCSFPLVFSGFRTSILTTMMTMTASTTRTTPSATSHTLWTVGLLSMITLLAYFVTDIGTLLSFGGGTYVCWLTFVFPPLMILKLSCRQSQLQSERPMAILTLVVGVILSMVGMQQFYQTHLLL